MRDPAGSRARAAGGVGSAGLAATEGTDAMLAGSPSIMWIRAAGSSSLSSGSSAADWQSAVGRAKAVGACARRLNREVKVRLLRSVHWRARGRTV